MSIQTPELKDYICELQLPQDFLTRKPDFSDRVRQLDATFDDTKHKRRNYIKGLFLSFVILSEHLLKQAAKTSFPEVFDVFEPLDVVSGNRKANSLTIGEPPLSLRVFYNAAESLIRHTLQRPAYPNCAPHATQSWEQYRDVFSQICRLSPNERAALITLIWQRIIAIPYIEGQEGVVREIRPFEHLINHFTRSEHEPPGVVLQALVYAYYRADSPSVTFRPYKVGAGSSRIGASGDVDGWIGRELTLSVEVKDLPISNSNIHELDQFAKQLLRWPNCTALVVAQSFTPEVELFLNNQNILCMTRENMAKNVSYWDVPKQKLAVREMYYYFSVIQRHPKLTKRFEQFCTENSIFLEGYRR